MYVQFQMLLALMRKKTQICKQVHLQNKEYFSDHGVKEQIFKVKVFGL